MSELQRRVHNNMLTSQAAMVGDVVHLRDRVAAMEARR
jgi:hypothetical protein